MTTPDVVHNKTTRLTTFDVPYAHDKITLLLDLERMKRISAAFAGLVPAYRKIESMDSTAFASVIAIGAEKNVSEIEPILFEMGLLDLKEPLLKYLNYLANGGRELDVAA